MTPADALARLLAWDRECVVALNAFAAHPRLVAALAVVSRLGDGLAWWALGIGLALFGGAEGLQCALHVALTAAVCGGVYLLAKRAIGRPRPYVHLESIRRGALPLDEFSFPSGHTLQAVALGVVTMSYYPWAAVALVPFILATAVSRVVLGLHYPSDVLAGAALGALLAGASLAFTAAVA